MLVNRNNIIKSMVLSLFILSSANTYAAPGSSSTPTNYHDTLAKTFGVVVTNPTTPQQLNVFNELLGSDGGNLSWPNFPRSWVQSDLKGSEDKFINVSFKANTPGVPLGFQVGAEHKTGFNYQYSKKISFVAVTTVDLTSGIPVAQNGITVAPQAIEAVRYTNNKTGRNSLNATKENPMIGFCVYELQLNITKSSDNKVFFSATAPIASATAETGINTAETLTKTQSVYSKFFQIDRNVPEDDYLYVKCADYFVQMVKPYIEADFDKVVNEYWGFHHPGNECQGTTPGNKNGDASCSEFYGSQNQDTKNRTVARCERQADGLNKCVLKSKANVGMCGLYKKVGGGYTTSKSDAQKVVARGGGARYIEATFFDGNVRKCDARLSCVISDEKPWGVFGFMFQNVAYCR